MLLKHENNPLPLSVLGRECRLLDLMLENSTPRSHTGGISVRHLSSFDCSPSTLSSILGAPPMIELPSSSSRCTFAISAATSDGEGPSSDSVKNALVDLRGVVAYSIAVDLRGVAYSNSPLNLWKDFARMGVAVALARGWTGVASGCFGVTRV